MSASSLASNFVVPGSGLAIKGAALANKIRKARALLKLKAGKLGIKIPKGALSKLGLGRKEAEQAEEAVVQGELSGELPVSVLSCFTFFFFIRWCVFIDLVFCFFFFF